MTPMLALCPLLCIPLCLLSLLLFSDHAIRLFHAEDKCVPMNTLWSYNGIFHLVDSWQERDEYRSVFKFRLVAVEGDEDFNAPPNANPTRRRIISTPITLAVWKRDGGKCIMCGASDELHFDHDLPWAKGGTPLTEANVQLLCARHNLEKHDRIL